jgi:hypothetical protein
VERAYRQATRVLGALLIVLGLTLVAVTVARGGGGLALGVVVGVLLAGLGAGRLALSRDRAHEREPA